MALKPQYLAIAERKWHQLCSSIPPEWRLPDRYIPHGMRLSPIDSIHQIDEYKKDTGHLFDVSRDCGLLSEKEIKITEGFDVRGLLSEIHSGNLKAKEVVTAFCKRAAIAQQLTRCLSEPLFTSALEYAQQLDDHLQRTGRVVGPLHGLPVTVKDSFNIAGVDSAVGITALAFRPATSDAPLVQLLRSLGAVIIAKTNVPQTMGFLDTVNHLAGRTLNPRNRRLTAGGSSGGEAVAVAMRASMVGFGTDLGGSVRIPAMCNGIYGFKPSDGRLPFGGQATGQPEGKLRVGLKAVAGLLARSIPDIETVMRELIPRAELFGSDCIPGKWQSETPSLPEHVSQKRLTVGVLRSDGLIVPLPPVANVLDEVAQILRRTAGVDVVEVPTPPLMSKCQAAANRLMDVDGSGPILDLLAQTSEPLMPYLQGKMVRRPPITVEQLFALQAHRTELENAMKQIWTTKDGRKVDAIILPVAPHPVPEIDRWGGVSYTSTFVLCDYPAGTIPVRDVTEADLEQEFDASTKQPLSRSDAINRKLWDKSTVDRRVYLNSSLSIQVITPRLHEYDLCQAMGVIDEALRKNGQMQNMPTPKL